MNTRLSVFALLATTLLGVCNALGDSRRPPPLPDYALFERIASIPETELSASEMAAARADGVADSMIYYRCAKLALENVGACPWLAFDERSESGVSVAGAIQAMILGLRQGALPTHTELFARYTGSAALADMLVFDRPLQPDYAALIAASDGEAVVQSDFRESTLNMLQRLVQGEPSAELDAVLKYLFHDHVTRGSDIALIRIIELGPGAVARFHAMHELGMLAGEAQYLPAPCAHPAAREYDALVRVLSFTAHPAWSAVHAEPWPGLTPECRWEADRRAKTAQVYGVRRLNRVSLAVSDNRTYRIRVGGGTGVPKSW